VWCRDDKRIASFVVLSKLVDKMKPQKKKRDWWMITKCRNCYGGKDLMRELGVQESWQLEYFCRISADFDFGLIGH
jgi:hypothetical protein